MHKKKGELISVFGMLLVIVVATQIQKLALLHLMADPIWTFVIVYRNVLLQQRKTVVHADSPSI